MDKASLILRMFFSVLAILLLSFSPALAAGKSLVVFPLVIYADQSDAYLSKGLRSMLVSRLSGGDIEVMGEERYDSLLTAEDRKGIATKKRAEELARTLGADYAIFGSVTKVGTTYSLDLSILELTGDGSKLTNVSETVDENQLIPKLSDVAYQFRAVITGVDIRPQMKAEAAPVAPEKAPSSGLFVPTDTAGPGFKPTGRVSIRLAVMAFDTGDLDGDGVSEWIVLGRNSLLVYRKQTGAFVLRGTFRASHSEDFLKVSVGDGDKNGKAEIYLVGRDGGRAAPVRTRVLEWSEQFKELYQRQGHVRIVKDPGEKDPVLLFQPSRYNEVFAGKISVMAYDEKGKLTSRTALPKLNNVQFYTLTPFDLDGDRNLEYIGLNQNAYLYVWDQEGKVLWHGGEEVGGTNNAVWSMDTPSELGVRTPFNSRLVITDIDRDGKNEVLVIKNHPLLGILENFKYFKSGVIEAYEIEGTRLSSALTSRKIDYCLMEMQAEGKALYLAATKSEVSDLFKGTANIMWFE